MVGPRTITVGELRDLLEGFDEDLPVIFASDYGDICHTKQAHPLSGAAWEVTLTGSAYSQSGFAVVDPDADADENDSEDDAPFLLLS